MKLKETFEDYLSYMRQSDYDEKTIGAHRHFLYGPLMLALGDRDIASLKLNDQAKVMETGKAYGEYGSQRAVTTFRGVVKYLKGEGYAPSFDFRDIKTPPSPPRKNEYFTDKELEQVFDAIDVTTIAGLRTRALFEVLYSSGMRISEACALDQKDIDWIEKRATILNAKFDEYQPVYFNERSLIWLKRYLDARKDKEIPSLFTSGRGRLLPQSSRTYIREHLKPRLKELGIEQHMKHHAFRKTFVTHLFEKGGDIVAIRDLARHNSPRTTLRYYAVANKQRSREMHTKLMNGGASTKAEQIKIIRPGEFEVAFQ